MELVADFISDVKFQDATRVVVFLIGGALIFKDGLNIREARAGMSGSCRSVVWFDFGQPCALDREARDACNLWDAPVASRTPG